MLHKKVLSLQHNKNGYMYIEFDKDYLRELFEQGRTSDKNWGHK